MRRELLERVAVWLWAALIAGEELRRRGLEHGRQLADDGAELYRRRPSEWWLYPSAGAAAVALGVLVARLS